MTSSRRLLFLSASCAFAVSALSLSAGDARAQRTAADIESARQAYNEGIALRDRGDMKGALEKFRAAHALGNTPITGLELCKTYATLRQFVEAREVCLGVARIPPLSGETQHSQEARNEAAKVAEDMKPHLSSLRIHITGVPAGREPTVTVDGVLIPAAALAEPRAVDPAVHIVTAKVGRGGETRATLETHEGETRDLDLAVQPPPPDDVPGPDEHPGGGTAPPPERKGNSLATVGWIGAGLFGGLGAIAGIVALSDKNDLQSKCTNDICGRDDHDELDHAKTMGTLSTISFVLAGGGVLMGIVGTLTAPKSTGAAPSAPPRAAGVTPTITPLIGPTGAGLRGTF